MAYSDKVIDHYENPRNVGQLDETMKNVGTGMVGAPACGDVMRLQIQVDDDGIIEDAKFKTYGCGSAIASSSLLTEWVKGKHLDDAEQIRNTEIAEELALPPVKIHCSVLAEDAIKTAIKDIREKQLNKMSITLTSSAKSQLRQSVADREKGIGVRVGVKRTGCSGLAYLMEYVDALADEDEVYQFDDVKLVIDKKSLIYLKGTELDYVKNGLNEGFEFKNPNVKNECGCGESFHV